MSKRQPNSLPYETGPTAPGRSQQRTPGGFLPHGWWIAPGAVCGCLIWAGLWWVLT